MELMRKIIELTTDTFFYSYQLKKGDRLIFFKRNEDKILGEAVIKKVVVNNREQIIKLDKEIKGVVAEKTSAIICIL